MMLTDFEPVPPNYLHFTDMFVKVTKVKITISYISQEKFITYTTFLYLSIYYNRHLEWQDFLLKVLLGLQVQVCQFTLNL